jgi:type VI secretion system protein ImpK
MDRITEITRECFDALIQLRRLDGASFPATATLQPRLRGFVDAMFQRAAQAGFSREDANDIAYAVVSLADDIVLSRPDSSRDDWASQSLQLHYFQENVAGEGFFTRLTNLRRDPRKREILHVYYLALLFGFEGRYRVRGGELELMKIVDGLQAELQRARRFDTEVLSPHGERPDEAHRSAGRAGLGVWIAAGALALAVLTYAGLHLSLGMSSGSVVSRIDSANIH